MDVLEIAEEIKVGKRLAASQVDQLKQAIKILLDVAGYVNYDDNVEAMLQDIEEENKAATVGNLERLRQERLSRQNKPASSGKGEANWSASVGQAIIGNLGRGKGGRFISMANVTSMMNQLEKQNINPEMFTAMQDLLAGKEVSASLLQQLQAAGLATDNGQASAKAAQIITAMETGEPDKLKEVLKPSGKGKSSGKGSKPPKPPKPTKDEITAKNIEKTGSKLIEQGRLTDTQLASLEKFANGETVDQSLMQELVDIGLVEIDEAGYYSFSSEGNSFWGAMENGNLRKALDSMNKAESKIADALERIQERSQTIEEEEARITAIKDEFTKLTSFPEMSNFLDFVNGKEVDTDFTQYGLTELDNNGKPITTKLGKQFATAIQKGKLREALDAFRKAGLEVTEETEKNFDNDFNEICTGFKVLSGQDDDYIVTWTTNSYEDREAETFTLKAITDYVQRNVDNENKGTVQFWHIPGSDFADTIAQMISGKFLVEAHKFRKDDIGTAFKEFFREYSDGHDLIAPEGWGCSHGFVYRKQDRQDGVYEWFDKKETSILPRNEAANIFTAISI